MKEYLKVGSLFPNGIGFSPRHTNEQVSVGTHAINSHDELVEMNRELLDVLRSIENDAGQVPCFMWKMIQDVIVKAGGAA